MRRILHKSYFISKWIFGLSATIYFLLSINLPTYSQNLVKNYSFEEFSICPGDHGQIDHCLFWNTPGEGTTDYCNNCNNGQYSVPINMWGTQNASNGKAYAHIISYYPLSGQYREYLQSELACELIEGEKYNVSFKVSLSDRSMRCVDRMGIYFSPSPVVQGGDNIISPQVTPQIRNQPGVPLTGKDNWMQIFGVYVAEGGEKFITIGNFKPDDSLAIVNSMSGNRNYASYYIDEVRVIPHNNMLDLGNDTIVCPGEKVILDASLPCDAEYLWIDGVNQPVRIIDQPGTYSVQINIGSGSLFDDITISWFDMPDIPFPSDTILCEGTSIVLDGGGSFASYLWQDESTDQYFTVEGPGWYWVECESEIGCRAWDTVKVELLEMPVFSLGPDTTICMGTTIELDPGIDGPYLEYTWNDYSDEKNISISDSGIYWLEITNPCGSLTDSVRILTQNCDPDIFLPNAFTPNSDGINDILMAKGANIEYFSMHIYDRWGQNLFISNDMLEGWDGTANGEYCPAGIYVWIISYQSISEARFQKAETLKGTVMLLR